MKMTFSRFFSKFTHSIELDKSSSWGASNTLVAHRYNPIIRSLINREYSYERHRISGHNLLCQYSISVKHKVIALVIDTTLNVQT